MSQPTRSTPAALELRGVSLAFRGNPVLEDIDLTLRPGDFVGLIGPNGAGKTVLLKIILGLLKPDRGSVHIYGEPAAALHGKVAWVPQFADFAEDFPICVRDVVQMGVLGAHRFSFRRNPQLALRVEAALDQVDLLDLQEKQVGKLSGGQMQRVLIARALAQNAYPSAAAGPCCRRRAFTVQSDARSARAEQKRGTAAPMCRAGERRSTVRVRFYRPLSTAKSTPTGRSHGASRISGPMAAK